MIRLIRRFHAFQASGAARLGCVGLLFFAFRTPASAAPDYATDVRPIFERSCFECHGPKRQRSSYRLDRREIAIKGGDSGEPAILPHDGKNSRLIRLVSGGDHDLRMPPEESGKPPLSAEEVATLSAWIDAGPSWGEQSEEKPEPLETHWSLKPLIKPPFPPGSSDPLANPIDAFVRGKLTEKNLTPSPGADRRDLIRRVSYDLIGLPPTPEEAEKFLNDANPRAYEDLVDRLLASPRHGERWARHWLDTIHFADTHGYEHDIPRDNAWRFRDYVIAAFNSDTPWPRFIREQLAADYFFPEETQLTPALGFLGAGTFDLSTYSTATVTFDYLDRDDLVTQTMTSFVSTTVNCARCHAHKFDPIPQEDYYAVQAVFAGVLKGDVAYDADPAIARERHFWNGLLAASEKRDEAALLNPENSKLAREWWNLRGEGARWEPLEIETFLSLEGAATTRREDGSIVVGGHRPERDTYVITGRTSLSEMTALRLDVLADDSLPVKGPGRADNGNLHLSEFNLRVFDPNASEPREIKIRRATADFNQTDWGIQRAIDGDAKTAWGIHPAEGESHYAVFELNEKLALKPGSRLAVTLKQSHGASHLIGAYRLSATGDTPEQAAAVSAEIATALTFPPWERTRDEEIAIAAHALRIQAEKGLEKLPAQSRVYAAAPSVDVVTGDPPVQPKVLGEPKPVHVLVRGDFDKPGNPAPPGALTALTHFPSRFELQSASKEAERRAALADWIAHPENVLTWRSIVNRVWHYHFGRGICDTPSDLGKMGGVPSHPELLDWLAVWFRDDAKGSLKELHRLIVTSETYRQSSDQREDAALIDADNRLLWRMNRQRLDADSYRDSVFAISGRLDLTMGGPPVRHFKETKGPQLTNALDYASYDWSSPGASRRSIYRFVWRGIPDPLMDALDFPDLGMLSPVRNFSVSSLQALRLFNNEFVLYHAKVLAERIETEAAGLEAQVSRAIQLLWQRNPTPEEKREFTEFARAHGLPALCRILFNSNEFLFVN